MTRQTKTPKQRAQEALAVEERRVAKYDRVVKRLQEDLENAIAQLAAAEERRDYLRKDPALKHVDTPSTTTPTTTAPTGGTTR